MSDTSPLVRQRNRPAAPARQMDLGVPEGSIEVTRAVYHRRQLVGQEEARVETVQVPLFHTAPARVAVEGSVTRNMGDFNSVRVGVRIEFPCYPEESEARRTYSYVSDLVDELLGEELHRAVTPPSGT